jgi:alkylation response protein AidB-like acyl-CoA dehydrogenase
VARLRHACQQLAHAEARLRAGPARNLLGEEGDQLWYVFEVIAPYFLMAMAGTYLGVAQAAFDIALEHAGTRRFAHTGELLGAEPVVAHRLGSMWSELERTRHLIYSAATGRRRRSGRAHPDPRVQGGGWRYGGLADERGDDDLRRQRVSGEQQSSAGCSVTRAPVTSWRRRRTCSRRGSAALS